MGLLSKWRDFQDNRKIKRIQRNKKLISNPKAIREDRQAAIDFFANLDDDEVAVTSLLDRFEYSLEHGINDTREKEAAMEGITKRDSSILPLVKERLKKTTRIAWPIKVINKVGDEKDILEILKDCLNFGDVAFDQAQVDKNYDILCYLRDFQLGDFSEKIAHFLNDSDERVRYAAVEVLIEQKSTKFDIAAALERFLADDSPENTRIRQSVVRAYAQNQWKVQRPDLLEGKPLLPGVTFNKAQSLLTMA